ncbi:hypothetical protein [Helicobacter rodentium]|uniref:hypothetical protein n=1 Tax=Helicobacter rodentium TaxID=59617 RepID=UPI00262EAFC7|nr:hypothetical protein [Helicobacter rodentium]
MAEKYTLLPITLKQSFANSGIKQRVPYQLPSADDDLNWLEGFTDAYQRPVISDNLGEKSGRYVRMGQINQILENVSQAILNIKQSLDNVSETIDKGIKAEIDKVVTNVNNALANRKGAWLMTLSNQNCAGLKNFTGININNYKTKGNAVANLEWCNGMPLKSYYANPKIAANTNYTCTRKNMIILTFEDIGITRVLFSAIINNNITIFYNPDNRQFVSNDASCIMVSQKDTYKYLNCKTYKAYTQYGI